MIIILEVLIPCSQVCSVFWRNILPPSLWWLSLVQVDYKALDSKDCVGYIRNQGILANQNYKRGLAEPLRNCEFREQPVTWPTVGDVQVDRSEWYTVLIRILVLEQGSLASRYLWHFTFLEQWLLRCCLLGSDSLYSGTYLPEYRMSLPSIWWQLILFTATLCPIFNTANLYAVQGLPSLMYWTLYCYILCRCSTNSS